MRTRVVNFFMVGRHFRALFLLAVLFPLPLQAEQSRIFMSHSEAVTALIQQADQTYARAANTSIQHFFNNIPVNAAICMGLAMHGQKRLAEQTPGYQDHYEALRREVHEFLGNLAKAHNFKNPFDGQPLDRQFLAGIFDSNASGAYNQWAVENRMPDPGVVRQPLILDRVTPQSLAKLHLKDDSIRLLDRTGPIVTQNAPPRPLENPAPPTGCPASHVLGTWWLKKTASPDPIQRYEITQTGDCTFVMRSPETADFLEFRYSGKWDPSSGPSFILTRYLTSRGMVESNEFFHLYKKPEGDEILILIPLGWKLYRNPPS